MKSTVPLGLLRAREIAARVQSPVGKPFAATRSGSTAILYLYDGIGTDAFGEGISPQSIVDALDSAKDATSLEVRINSPGGFVGDGITVYNAIRRFKGRKIVHVDGIAASIASIIALAGDRVITEPGGTWMVHEPWSGLAVLGTADQIEDTAKKEVAALRKMRETLLDLYVAETGQKRADLSRWLAAETWMNAEEALARGFTDEVAGNAAAPAPTAARKATATTVRPVAVITPARLVDGVGRLEVIGPIAEGESSPGCTGPQGFRRQVDALIAAKARAAVLVVNSSGGAVPSALAMRGAIADLRRSGCRVVAHLFNAHSAAYLAALAADRLVLSEHGSVLIHPPSGAEPGACYAAAAQIAAILEAETVLSSAEASGMTCPSTADEFRFRGWNALSSRLVDDVGGEADALAIAREFAAGRSVPASSRQVALDVRRQQRAAGLR